MNFVRGSCVLVKGKRIGHVEKVLDDQKYYCSFHEDTPSKIYEVYKESDLQHFDVIKLINGENTFEECIGMPLTVNLPE